MAKSRKMKSKKELEIKGRALGDELDRRHNKEELISEFYQKSNINPTPEISDVTWNSIEEFTEAVTASGMLFNSDFIPVNIPALYESYTSNSAEFKESAAYKFLTQ